MSKAFPVFGFGERLPVPPSRAVASIRLLGAAASVLVGVLGASVALSCWLCVAVVRAADVVPYVADGGVAGCAVPQSAAELKAGGSR